MAIAPDCRSGDCSGLRLFESTPAHHNNKERNQKMAYDYGEEFRMPFVTSEHRQKRLKIDIKPIQFGYIIQVFEQSHIGCGFGKDSSEEFNTPFLRLCSGSSPHLASETFFCRGRNSSADDKKLILLYIELRGDNSPESLGYGYASKKWCDSYIKNLEKSVEYYNEYWGKRIRIDNEKVYKTGY